MCCSWLLLWFSILLLLLRRTSIILRLKIICIAWSHEKLALLSALITNRFLVFNSLIRSVITLLVIAWRGSCNLGRLWSRTLLTNGILASFLVLFEHKVLQNSTWFGCLADCSSHFWGLIVHWYFWSSWLLVCKGILHFQQSLFSMWSLRQLPVLIEW